MSILHLVSLIDSNVQARTFHLSRLESLEAYQHSIEQGNVNEPIRHPTPYSVHQGHLYRGQAN